MKLLFSYFVIPIFFVLWHTLAFGQIDSINILPKVEIVGNGIRGSFSNERIEKWDSLKLSQYSHQSIAQILEQESGVFVRNYGPGSLATLSTRGGSAGHTVVLWNGLPIQSPMLGLLDASLLPPVMFDEVTLKLGGQSSNWGSGAISGILSLNNRIALNTPFQVDIGSTYGSFNQRSHVFKNSWGNEKVAYSTTLSYSRADNDFSFKLLNGEEKQLSNAFRKQLDFLQELQFKIADNQRITLNYWHQNAEREIPPSTTQTRSEARQEDHAHRVTGQYSRIGKRSVWNARLGFFHEEIFFEDPQILLEALNYFWTTTADIEGAIELDNNGQILVGATQMLNRAFSDSYGSPILESRTSLFSTLKKQWKKFETQISVRQSLVQGDLVGFSPALSVSRKINNWFSTFGKLSRNYRIPTLNDRYWRPGGNPDLLPESGWAQSLGANLNFISGKSQIFLESNIYSRIIQNWILWSPSENANYWSAQNLAEVWSRGFEQRVKLIFPFEKIKLNTSLGYDYIRSTNRISLETPSIEAGQQLIYTPIHQASGTLGISTKYGSISYRHRYVSDFRGPNDQLESHHLGYFQLNGNFKLGQNKGSFFFKIENIWNENYRVVERRPMPGRQFNLGINFQFKKT